jgi:PD-(D/E)XK endonuclease
VRSRLINRRRQGDLGEASAIEWLTRQGATVFLPVGHSPDHDLLAAIEDNLLRVQVKTTTQRKKGAQSADRWSVQLATNGGNQSWTGVTKVLDATRCDAVFVLAGDGRRWFIPSSFLEGSRTILVGGWKYSEFEIEAGPPITELVYGDGPGASRIGSPRGSAGVGEPGWTVNPVALPEWVRIPPPPSPEPTGRSHEWLAAGQTRISANHQVTIPMQPFEAAQLAIGDRFRVLVQGSGRVVLERIEPPRTPGPR